MSEDGAHASAHGYFTTIGRLASPSGFVGASTVSFSHALAPSLALPSLISPPSRSLPVKLVERDVKDTHPLKTTTPPAVTRQGRGAHRIFVSLSRSRAHSVGTARPLLFLARVGVDEASYRDEVEVEVVEGCRVSEGRGMAGRSGAGAGGAGDIYGWGGCWETSLAPSPLPRVGTSPLALYDRACTLSDTHRQPPSLGGVRLSNRRIE
ncbi:hypothetical protein R3P38DRAFT_3189081 [Favolaschia claudopus]|uniref:Uncharacterized protein n=1 Tax=Favolaschia claudopus TaxID=2862362 RepID=A0AAW0BUE5_9AGAR